ncbi:MAG: hypothetical protein GF330_13280 [Candidatus Eisenbacteria bacterium]|nr:hypothetical protein [Candidatus Eisenbacteria bacterium]
MPLDAEPEEEEEELLFDLPSIEDSLPERVPGVPAPGEDGPEAEEDLEASADEAADEKAEQERAGTE